MLEIKDITISIGDKKILENFSLKVDKSEKIWIKGPSGRGKSTLLKVILGYVRYQSGEIFLGEELIDSKNIDILRKEVGYLSQNLPLSGKVEKIVEEVEGYLGNKEKFSRDKFLIYLERLGISRGYLEKDYATLSGGEKQRLMLSLLLSLERKIYILDEITSQLDMESKEKVDDLLSEIDKGIIIVSHHNHWKRTKLREVYL